MTSSTAVPRCTVAALSIAESCFLSPEKLRPTKVAPSWMARRQVSIAGSWFTTPDFERRARVGGGAELALGQAVHPVVLDDVDQRQVAPDQVHELAHADRRGVPVARDPEADQRPVGEQRARGHRRHAPVHRVEGVRPAHEVGRRLRRAADAGQLGHPLRLDAQLEHRLEDALADGVVPAARAEGGLAALVVGLGQSRAGWSSPPWLTGPPGPRFVGHAAGIERQPGDVGHRPEPGHQLRRQVNLQQGRELPVPVLLHHVHPRVPLDERLDLRRERVGRGGGRPARRSARTAWDYSRSSGSLTDTVSRDRAAEDDRERWRCPRSASPR